MHKTVHDGITITMRHGMSLVHPYGDQFQVAAFSCSKFVFFCLTPFSASKCCFLHLFIFFRIVSAFFSTSSFFTASKPFERASRFFTVHICLNPFNLLDFFIGKKLTLFRLFSLSQELLEVLVFAKSGKLTAAKHLFSISLQVFQKSKSLIAKIRFKKWVQFQF